MKGLEQKDSRGRRQAARYHLTEKAVQALETDGYLVAEERPDGQIGYRLTQAGLIQLLDDAEGPYGRIAGHD